MAAKPDLKAKLEQVNEQIAEKTRVAQTKWAEFEQHRDQFAAAGDDANRTDTDEFKKAEDTHRAYAQAAQEVEELKTVQQGIFGMLGTGPQANGNGDGPARKQQDPQRGETKSFGERAVESDEYKQLVQSGALASERMPFTAMLGKSSESELKALITGASDTSAGAFVVNDVQPYVEQPRQNFRIFDLITVGSTDGDTVEYVRQGTFTNVAAETAEATTSATGTKPEATLDFAKVTETVKTIAHTAATTRRALADAGQLRTIIDSQLRYGLQLRLVQQLINGNGTGENIRGILNTSNILSQPKGSDSIADAVHKGITQIRLGFLEPNGVALHPSDWEVVRLSRDDSGAAAGTGGYLYGPPALAGTETMWGLPVAVSAVVPDDTGLVGDFSQAVLWLREGMQVLATDSHDDWFFKNLIALLAEMRAAFGVLLPAAFCKVTSLD